MDNDAQITLLLRRVRAGDRTAEAELIPVIYRDLHVLAEGQFPKQADDLRLYKRIATMVRDVPLKPIADAKPNWAGAAELTGKWELNALTKRLQQLAAQ